MPPLDRVALGLALALLAGCSPPIVYVYILPPPAVRPMASLPAAPPKGPDRFERSCSDGDARGCNNLGRLYDTGEGGMAVDHARAAEFYQRACDAKNGPGCRNLAALYGSGRGAKEGIAKDPAKAAEYHARGCDLKHAESCYYLGIDHQMGDGVAKNDTRAAELYTIACHAGYAEACNNLGYMYEQGLGVTRDLSKAREIFRQACASGVASGCSSWAFRLQAAPADLVRAAILYRLGCDLGDKHACTNLKSLPEQRSRSFAKRARVVRAELDRDCSEGSAESCRLAGVLLQNGIGIPPEPVEARDRFEKGCQFLDRLSCDALKKTDEGKDGPP